MKSFILLPSCKQKFFHDLYSFIGEDKPIVNEESHIPHCHVGHISDTESFEIVHFGDRDDLLTRQCSEHSGHKNKDLLEDSVLLLPDRKLTMQGTECGSLDAASRGLMDEAVGEDQVTALTAREEDVPYLDLKDYYDLDLMTGEFPRWKFPLEVYTFQTDQPVLFLCLQVMDEYIFTERLCDRMHWMVEACMTARCIFSAMLENQQAPGVEDICFQNYLNQKSDLPGVVHDVWRLIQKYKLEYPDIVGDFRCDTALMRGSPMCPLITRDLFGIFGMTKSMAEGILHNESMENTVQCAAKIKLMHGASPSKSFDAMMFGIQYLEYVKKHDSIDSPHRFPVRHVLSRVEWKTAIIAIRIHLQKWCPRVETFPCGSFSRGAVVGSVVDIIVKVPDDMEYTTSQCKNVVQALIAATIIEDTNVYYLTEFRALGIIHFKERILALDVKVATSPRCWFALTYYTGPARFVKKVFSKLLHHSLKDVNDTSFGALNHELNRLYGVERLRGIKSEEDVFNLIDWKYPPPSSRG
ncbi:unnamed protein product [Albugo candida]|uniref:DNA polymerase n=1 Tax=Albugo candida TaxID=65357 RepID=A0A024FZ90_9STRA|nr:unnamed protein product [Albugo candida]|eukprot:CCI39742.1 unnamed protein product [Albugo candida]